MLRKDSMTIEVQIFLGVLQTSDLKKDLYLNSKWQNAQMEKKTLLKEAHWNQKVYLGYYLSAELNYLEIEANKQKIQIELQNYCLQFNVEKHPLLLFPQVFIH